MKTFLVLFYVMSTFILNASSAMAQVASAPRQLMVLKPGLDGIYGTWVAAVMNHGAGPAIFKIPVLLPDGAKDFQPLEGIAKEDIKIDDQGVWIEKAFANGTNVVSVAFVSGAEYGRANLKFKARADVGEMTIMTPKGMLEVQSTSFVDGGVEDQDNQKYAIYTSNKMILEKDEILLTVNGVPEGRMRLFLIGLSFAVILTAAVVGLAYKTKPIYLKSIPEVDAI